MGFVIIKLHMRILMLFLLVTLMFSVSNIVTVIAIVKHIEVTCRTIFEMAAFLLEM